MVSCLISAARYGAMVTAAVAVYLLWGSGHPVALWTTAGLLLLTLIVNAGVRESARMGGSDFGRTGDVTRFWVWVSLGAHVALLVVSVAALSLAL